MATYKSEQDANKHRVLGSVGDPLQSRGISHGQYSFVDVTLTSDQINALNATPITVVSAPGAGKALIFKGAFCFLDYGGTAWAGSSETITLKYADGSGATVGTVTEAFMESTADAYQWVEPVTAVAQVNQPLVAAANADFTTGNSPLSLRIYYQVITADLSAV